MGVACLGNCLYAVGGHDGTQHLNTVECYNQKVRMRAESRVSRLLAVVISHCR